MMTIEDNQNIDISSKSEFYKYLKDIFLFFFKVEFKIEHLLLVAFILFVVKQLFLFYQKKNETLLYRLKHTK